MAEDLTPLVLEGKLSPKLKMKGSMAVSVIDNKSIASYDVAGAVKPSRNSFALDERDGLLDLSNEVKDSLAKTDKLNRIYSPLVQAIEIGDEWKSTRIYEKGAICYLTYPRYEGDFKEFYIATKKNLDEKPEINSKIWKPYFSYITEIESTSTIKGTMKVDEAEGSIKAISFTGETKKVGNELITPQGKVESSAKNLLNFDGIEPTPAATFFDGELSLNWTSEFSCVFLSNGKRTIKLDRNKTYTLSFAARGSAVHVRIDSADTRIITTNTKDEYMYYRGTISGKDEIFIEIIRKEQVGSADIILVMLEEGSEDTAYEPYKHSSINASEIAPDKPLYGIGDIKNTIEVFADGTGVYTKKVDYDNATGNLIKLPIPTITPLTSKEVAEFLSLKTFNNGTITTDCETEITYYKNTAVGQAVADVTTRVSTNAVNIAGLKMLEADGTNFELTTSEGGVLIKHMEGASSQDGTPTFNNPIEIKSADVNITSRTANLIPFPYYENSVTRGGITFTTLADGSVSASGTASTNTYIRIVNNTQPLFIEKGKTYRLSEGIVSNDIRIGLLYRKGSSAVGTDVNDGQNGTIFTVPNDLDFDGIFVQCWIRGGTTVNNAVFKPMITEVAEDGTYPTKYAPPFSTTADTSITLRAIGDVKDELQFINDKFQIVRKCEEYRIADFNDSAIKSSGNDGENTCCYRWTVNTYSTIKSISLDGLSNINIIKRGGATDIRLGYGYININASGVVLVYLSLPKEIDTLDKARAFAIEHNLKVIMCADGVTIEEISNEDAIKLLGLKSWEDTTYLIQNNECNGAITLMYGTTPEIATSLRAKNIALSNERKIDDITSALLETTSLME